ncbi:MAG: T9SS type A sorting domain-containing protein [Bacteroidota bacterium]
MKIRFLFVFVLVLLGMHAHAQDSLKLMHYNLLYYGKNIGDCNSSNNDVDEKNEDLRKIIDYYKPDIFSVNELDGEGVTPIEDDETYLLNNALNTDSIIYYKKVPFETIYLANTLFYNHNKIGLKSYKPIRMKVGSFEKIINAYRFYYKSDDLATTNDTLFFTCFVAHLKAGSGSQRERADEVDVFMDHIQNEIGAPGNYFLMGDLNVYTSDEAAFQKLINPDNSAYQFNDPIDQLGNWNDNEDFKNHHTQSTHSYGGCHSGGGMDDRFDFILVSDYIMDGAQDVHALENTYQAMGQDGSGFNGSLNRTNNENVPEDIARALYDFSDHLPVTMEIKINRNPATEIQFDTVFYEPEQPVNNDSATVYAQITDPDNQVKELDIVWGDVSESYEYSDKMTLDGNFFSTSIPSYEAGERVYFKVRTLDSQGTILSSSNEYSYVVEEATQLEKPEANIGRYDITNPVHNNLKIFVNGQVRNLNYSIGNMSGKVLKKGNFGKRENERLNIPFHQYPPGMYWIRLVPASGITQTIKFIKLETK